MVHAGLRHIGRAVKTIRKVTRKLRTPLILGVACLGIGCFRPEPTLERPRPIAPPTPAFTRTDPWVLIDSRSEILSVYRKGHPPATFENVAFGAAGVGEKKRRGDDITPRGTFTIGWISRQSKFTRFIGLDYPNLYYAERGLNNKTISRPTFDRIARALREGSSPPQDTPLGGLIGIHGVGRGDPEIHKLANWTAGCIALRNDQILRLVDLVRPGVQVEIR